MLFITTITYDKYYHIIFYNRVLCGLYEGRINYNTFPDDQKFHVFVEFLSMFTRFENTIIACLIRAVHDNNN